MRTKMTVTISAEVIAPVDANLRDIRAAVARALRDVGVTVPSDALVKVEGKLG